MLGRLNSIVLPSHDEFKRHYVVPVNLRDANSDNQYDFHTLVYDAFYIPSKRAICLICPRLFNFEEVIRKGTFTAEGEKLRIASIWNFKRYSQIWIRCRRYPAHLGFQHGSFHTTIQVSQEQKDLFRGLNCAILKSKNNDLRWIKDWAHYHVHVHGLQGLIVFDNASNRYEPQDVLETLQNVPGLRSVQVIPTPFTYGCKHRGETKFLQVGILNIARLRFYVSAAAVLCTDVDELVGPVGENGIFAATRHSPLGYQLFRGRWLDSVPRKSGEAARHSDHVYRRLDDRSPSTKYCIDPQGFCRFSHWDVHGAVRGFLKNILTTSKIEYWHCRQINTNWQYDRSHSPEHRLEHDRTAEDVLGKVFETEHLGVS